MVKDALFSLGAVVALIVVAFIVFLVTREFFCWYYKINKRSEYEKAIFFLLYKYGSRREILTKKDKSDLFLFVKDKELKEFVSLDVNRAEDETKK